MSKPDFKDSRGKPDEMFDFLDENAREGGARPVKSRRRRSFDMPIIRKPVPIAQSGPMRLDNSGQANVPHPARKPKPVQRPVPTRPDPHWHQDAYADEAYPRTSGIKKYAAALVAIVLLGGAVLAYTVYVQIEPETIAATDDDQPGITLLNPPNSPPAEETPASAEVAEIAEVDETSEPAQTDAIAEIAQPTNSLFNQFSEQVQLLENLLANNELDEAERVIVTMDRAVYGYGEGEFSAIEQRIANQRAADVALNGEPKTVESDLFAEATDADLVAADQSTALAEPLPEEQRLLEAQQLAEQQRLAEAKRILEEEQAAEQQRIANEARAAEAAKQAEAQRLADEAAAEQAQLLTEQANLVEQARLDEEARLAEAERAEQNEQARLAERARLAEQSRQAERARLAEAERLAAEQIAETLAGQPASIADESLALATAKAEDRIFAERSRQDREVAADIARQEAQEQESQRIRSEEALVTQPSAPKPASASITDDDFNFVASKFVELKTAVTNQDINSVIALTKPSGKRIQQMLPPEMLMELSLGS